MLRVYISRLTSAGVLEHLLFECQNHELAHRVLVAAAGRPDVVGVRLQEVR